MIFKLNMAKVAYKQIGKMKAYAGQFFTYSTTRSATIQSRRVGIVYRIVQFLLISYIFGYLYFIMKEKAFLLIFFSKKLGNNQQQSISNIRVCYKLGANQS